MAIPILLTTWHFGVPAARQGIERLLQGASALDAVEAAANLTEEDPHVNSVGYGGLPNTEGIVELDAAIMDGATHAAGAVGALQQIRHPISVARRVMERTPHVMLVGEYARRFAVGEGFPSEDLLTDEARARWIEWQRARSAADVSHFHDTIGLVALDSQGDFAVGCTTSGMAWKVPGRVGDSPIIGSGLYVDNEVGGAAGTGHGDEMMKANLSYRVVLLMEQGRTPDEACTEALRYLLRKRPPESLGNYSAALIAIRKDGLYGGAGTLSGFEAPNRLWQWASAVGDPQANEGTPVILHEGPYVSSDTILPSLLPPGIAQP